MKKRTITALILATSVLSSVAYASCDNKENGKKGAHPKQGAKKFMMIDANNDGKLSKEEMQTFHENHFMKIDTDKDGFITKEEMKAGHKAKQEGKKDRKDGKQCPKKSDDE
jgi:Ca2+-binding EF-hand superfamily protein